MTHFGLYRMLISLMHLSGDLQLAALKAKDAEDLKSLSDAHGHVIEATMKVKKLLEKLRKENSNETPPTEKL